MQRTETFTGADTSQLYGGTPRVTASIAPQRLFGLPIYGSVTNADIAECLVARTLEIDKRQIQLDEPIKQLGEFTVAVKIHRDVTTNVRVRVVREGDDAADPA